jgi:predicted transcriptional regulator
VHDDYATLRVSHALEAYRFGVGRWPQQLAQLHERGILTRDQLASDQGRPYYYVERVGGAVLLAPER